VSDTPRTDNEAWSEGGSVPELITAELGRQLERELTAAKEENAAAKELLSATQTECLARANDLNHGADREIVLEDTIALLRKRVEAADGLAAAMEGIGNYTGEGGPGTPWRDIVRDLGARAREVLVEFRATEGKK